MQRLIITGPGEARFEDVPVPDCPPDGLLVRARLTAVSTGTELRVYRAQPVDEAGRFIHERVPFELPAENGYSMVGNVVAVGKDVTGFAAGDRVFAPAPHKEVAAIPADLALKLPPAGYPAAEGGIPDEQAVFLNILEVAHIALRRGKPGPGENVAVIGQGVVGLSAVALCRAFGFRTVAVDVKRDRLDVARQMGADLAVSPDDDRFHEMIDEFTQGGCDLVLEAASSWAAVKTGLEIAREEAKLVIVSRHTQTPRFNPAGHPFLGKKLTLLTSYGYPAPGHRWDRDRSRALVLELLARGRVDVSPMITERSPWDRLPEIYARYDAGEAGLVGAVLHWPADGETAA